MKKLLIPLMIAMMLMSQGCIMRDLAGKLDLSRLWKKPQPEAVAVDELDMSKVVWLDPDISGWPITEKYLADHTGDPGHITYWNSPGIMQDWKDDNGSVGNPWIFIPSEELGEPAGKWYATTWEHITRSNPRKPKVNCNGYHIKKPKVPETWMPINGKTYPQMYSGMARRGYLGTVARSPVVMKVWR